jgi:16S rRNA G966 N2-methylase RsmD
MSDLLNKLTNERFQGFISANENADITKLLLTGNKPDVDIKLAAAQILSKRKSKGKLTSWLGVEGLVLPPPLSIEQASSDTTSDYKAQLISGDHLVDLTGGMGIDTLAFSDQFALVTYVEQDSWLCEVFDYNVKKLGKNNIVIINQRAEEFLSSFNGKAVFYIDPARRDDLKKKVFRFDDCTPDLTKLLFFLKEKACRLLVKASPMIDITEGVRALKYVEEVHIISIKNDCKEVLFDLKFEQPNENPLVKTVNFTDGPLESFQFNLKQDQMVPALLSKSKKYLFEPNSSVLKGGGYASIGQAFPISKLHQNTHLFTSDKLIEGFPGRKFIIIKDSVSKEDLNVLLQTKKANIITRNYPLKPEEIKKKYKIKDGGDHYLIGYRDLDNKPRLLIALRLN